VPPLQILLDTYGEWSPAEILLGVVFLVAVGGVSGLGYWVVRGEMRNRSVEAVEHSEGTDTH
jgi:hypothetical protein